MASNKSKKFKISLSVILFAMVLVYLAYHMLSYVSNDNLSVYKVREVTSLETNDSFTGLILRDEIVVNSEDTGYVNYYLSSGSKCAVGDIAYSIDENGSFNDKISANDGISSLSTDNLETMADILSKYSVSYTSVNFDSSYTLRSNINNSLIGFLNIDDESTLNSMGVDTRFFKTYKATSSGLIEYYTDGFENIDEESLNTDMFNQSNYNKTVLKTGDKINNEEAAYKLITNEKWSIYVMLDEDTVEKYSENDRLSIEFTEYGIKTTALFEIISGSDGCKYGKFTLSKYMIKYAESRYLNLTIINNTNEGLKIPKSAITTKEFFKIPIKYLTTGGNSNYDGFNVETAGADGNTVTFKSPDIAYKDNEYVYLSKDQIDIGSVLIKPDSDEKVAVSQTEELYGVYQVNQGYAIFKIINIIDEDSDYAIVESDLSYSIDMYDMISLNASDISDGDKIY